MLTLRYFKWKASTKYGLRSTFARSTEGATHSAASMAPTQSHAMSGHKTACIASLIWRGVPHGINGLENYSVCMSYSVHPLVKYACFNLYCVLNMPAHMTYRPQLLLPAARWGLRPTYDKKGRNGGSKQQEHHQKQAKQQREWVRGRLPG